MTIKNDGQSLYAYRLPIGAYDTNRDAAMVGITHLFPRVVEEFEVNHALNFELVLKAVRDHFQSNKKVTMFVDEVGWDALANNQIMTVLAQTDRTWAELQFGSRGKIQAIALFTDKYCKDRILPQAKIQLRVGASKRG